ncbi:MAG: hypothetical protein K2N85_08160 [Lachnospiraceae bacterium]|nr:hypothetical protein [Lachnospiraceae bacterium]
MRKSKKCLHKACAANVIASFTCWHEYLHGSDEGRVREIYGKMVTDSYVL